ncbi:hypothetical protein OESDEN_15679 [Oesophagostomum dentatum]|uniref:Uncharacterized protein n=1 Tax=Oesophagostomum dentatum TaxID=61180 RepID=A0A0B1SN46_OESDE|nr:hypothetical protein OESDEN_15679 [Oesophagostomum dentatum]
MSGLGALSPPSLRCSPSWKTARVHDRKVRPELRRMCRILPVNIQLQQNENEIGGLADGSDERIRKGDTISPKLFTTTLQYAVGDLNWEKFGICVTESESLLQICDSQMTLHSLKKSRKWQIPIKPED